MKRNIILGSIFAFLLGVAYIYEEILPEKDKESLKSESSLFKLSENDIKSFEWDKFVLINQNNSWHVSPGKHPVDAPHFENFLTRLGHLQVIRTLNNEDIKDKIESFIPADSPQVILKTTEGEIVLKLGIWPGHGRDFYLQIIKNEVSKIVMVYDATPEQIYYKGSEKHAYEQKYYKLKKYFLADRNIFLPHTLLPKNTAIKNIYIDNERNRPYYLNLDKMVTTPEVYNEGISYSPANFKAFKENVLGLRAINVYEKNEDEKEVLSNKVATLGLNFKSINLKLYKKLYSKEGNFVFIDGQNLIYELNPADAKMFFYNVQDFWDLRAIDLKREELLAGTTEHPFKIQFSTNEEHELILNPGKDFSVKLKTPHEKLAINQRTMGYLFAFLNGQFEAARASRISLKSETYEEILSKTEWFKLSFKDFNLRVAFRENEIIVSVLDFGHNLHYYRPEDFPLSADSSKYFYYQ